jgi:hypothetical protein
MNLLSLVGLRLDNICQIRRKWYYSSVWNFLQSKQGADDLLQVANCTTSTVTAVSAQHSAVTVQLQRSVACHKSPTPAGPTSRRRDPDVMRCTGEQLSPRLPERQNPTRPQQLTQSLPQPLPTSLHFVSFPSSPPPPPPLLLLVPQPPP